MNTINDEILGKTLLQAARDGTPSVIDALVSQGADVNFKHDFGRTPLKVALWASNRSNITALVAHGADVNDQDYDHARDTPLNVISYIPGQTDDEKLSITKILLSAGADPNIPNKRGQNPLHNSQSPQLIAALVGAGADVNHQDNNGQTPLHRSVWAIRPEVVSALLVRGADPSIIDREGKRPDQLIRELARVKPPAAIAALDKAFLDHAAQRTESPEQQTRKPRKM
jgi:ankyrin repeat protein